MTWFWIAAVSAIGAVLVEVIRRRAQRSEQAFFADQDRVAEETQRIRQRTWIAPLSRVGAGALLIAYAGMLALFLFVVPGAFAISFFYSGEAPRWFGSGLLLSGAALLLPAPLGAAATILCRCGKCAGWLFDNAQPARKGFIGAGRENWQFVLGKGRCPRCGAAA